MLQTVRCSDGYRLWFKDSTNSNGSDGGNAVQLNLDPNPVAGAPVPAHETCALDEWQAYS